MTTFERKPDGSCVMTSSHTTTTWEDRIAEAAARRYTDDELFGLEATLRDPTEQNEFRRPSEVLPLVVELRELRAEVERLHRDRFRLRSQAVTPPVGAPPGPPPTAEEVENLLERCSVLLLAASLDEQNIGPSLAEIYEREVRNLHTDVNAALSRIEAGRQSTPTVQVVDSWHLDADKVGEPPVAFVETEPSRFERFQPALYIDPPWLIKARAWLQSFRAAVEAAGLPWVPPSVYWDCDEGACGARIEWEQWRLAVSDSVCFNGERFGVKALIWYGSNPECVKDDRDRARFDDLPACVELYRRWLEARQGAG